MLRRAEPADGNSDQHSSIGKRDHKCAAAATGLFGCVLCNLGVMLFCGDELIQRSFDGIGFLPPLTAWRVPPRRASAQSVLCRHRQNLVAHFAAVLAMPHRTSLTSALPASMSYQGSSLVDVLIDCGRDCAMESCIVRVPRECWPGSMFFSALPSRAALAGLTEIIRLPKSPGYRIQPNDRRSCPDRQCR